MKEQTPTNDSEYWDEAKAQDWMRFVALCGERWSDTPAQTELLELVEGNKDIAVVLHYQFGDSAKDWLYRNIPAIGDKKPIDFLRSERLKTQLREISCGGFHKMTKQSNV